MAWAITNTTGGGPTGEVNSVSFSFDCSGGNLLVLTIIRVAVGTLNTPTYNGVSMTAAGTPEGSGGGVKFVYYLANPASGSNTLTWSNSSGNFRWSYAVVAASGADTADLLEGVSQGSDNTNPIGGSVTQANDVPSLGILIVNEDTSGQSFSPDGGATEVFDSSEGDWGTSATSYLAFTGSGSKTMSSTFSTSVTSGGFIMALFNGSAAVGPTNLKSLDTNVKANIKSYNTNVLANIKSINTNA